MDFISSLFQDMLTLFVLANIASLQTVNIITLPPEIELDVIPAPTKPILSTIAVGKLQNQTHPR